VFNVVERHIFFPPSSIMMKMYESVVRTEEYHFKLLPWHSDPEAPKIAGKIPNNKIDSQ
jgi:hypothetical protein